MRSHAGAGAEPRQSPCKVGVDQKVKFPGQVVIPAPQNALLDNGTTAKP